MAVVLIRYNICLFAYLLFYLVGMLLAPILPMLSVLRDGKCNNSSYDAIEPRLPTWLSWFDTDDNSLYGDEGWRTKHAPNIWNSYLGKACWLWRNCACGFSREVLTETICTSDVFECAGDVTLNKNQWRTGWFAIRTSVGIFQFRSVIMISRLQLSVNLGWLLDDRLNCKSERPFLVPFTFQPQIKVRPAK